MCHQIKTVRLMYCLFNVKSFSWAGRRGYRALPGNQFLIDVSRLEKDHRKRLAMLKS